MLCGIFLFHLINDHLVGISISYVSDKLVTERLTSYKMGNNFAVISLAFKAVEISTENIRNSENIDHIVLQKY